MTKYYTKYGLGIAIVLIVYFLITKLIGLHQFPVLSALNGVIIGGGIFFSLKSFKSNSDVFKYRDGFELGVFTGGLATIVFTAFMAIYCYQIDTEFARRILETWNLDYNTGTLIIVFSIFLMGMSTSVVLSLAFMQLLKTSWNTSKNA